MQFGHTIAFITGTIVGIFSLWLSTIRKGKPIAARKRVSILHFILLHM